MVWQNGVAVDLPLRSFHDAAFARQYHYPVEPSDAVFVYAKPSGSPLAQAGFDVPPDATDDAKLILTGLDDDPPGATVIHIAVDGQEIFDGENRFKENAWTKDEFPIRAAILQPHDSGEKERASLMQDFQTFESRLDRFSRNASAAAEEIDGLTTSTRRGLVWRPLHLPADWWKSQFVRGVCYCPFSQNVEYSMKSFRHLGATLLYSYAGHYNAKSEWPAILDQVAKVGLPYFQFTLDLSNGSRESLHLGNQEALLTLDLSFLKTVRDQGAIPIHLAVDEPNFRERLAKDPGGVEAFRAYLASRRAPLHETGIYPGDAPKPRVKLTSAEDRPLWMEWQLFKQEHMASQFGWLWDQLHSRGILTFIIIQDHQAQAPQLASYAAFGRELPLISTNLYDNGRIREAFCMDLLRNAGPGRAVLCAGSGWSDKSPAAFRRSLDVGMTHADGVIEWKGVYFDEYRDPKAFWPQGMKPESGDRLKSWNPDYWSIMETECGRMAQADPFLSETESGVRTVLLHSERTAISDSAVDARPGFENSIGLYSDLVRRQVCLDAKLLDGITSRSLELYRVALLSAARVMTGSEERAIRQWVRAGGTLIVSADTSLCDEWGRARSDYALADVFGAHAEGTLAKGQTFTLRGETVRAGSDSPTDASARPWARKSSPSGTRAPPR